jgi:hypothetical protein
MNDYWHELRGRWQELFMLLDAVDLKLSPRQAAEKLGLQSTGTLHRELRRRGLPVFRELRDWHYVLQLHELAERDTLARVAFIRDTYPSVLYRFVRRVTRWEWRTIAGLSHAELVAMARRRLEVTLR